MKIEPTKRIQLFDIARGCAILLVILMHWQAWFPFWAPSDGVLYKCLAGVNSIFSPMRMEMLFFISGLFVKLKVGFFNKKVTHILYPYLLWSLLLFVLDGPANPLHLKWIYFLNIFFGTTSLTWYLFFLFNFYVLIFFIQKFREINVWIVALFYYFVADKIETALVPEFLQASWVSYESIGYYFLFFYAGYHFSDKKKVIVNFLQNEKLIKLSFLSFLVVAITSLQHTLSATSLLYLPWVLFGLIFIFYLSQKMETMLIGKVMLIFGEKSIFYYILHYVIFDAYFQIEKFFGIEISRDPCAAFCLLFIALTLPWLISKIWLLRLLFKLERKGN